MITLLRCRKFDVIEQDVLGSDGRMHDRQIVVHPGAVVVLPFVDDDHIVLLHQYRIAVDQRLQELPAGTLDQPGEPPEQAAIRELEEEAGYRAGRMEPLAEFFPSPGILSERMVAYVATDLTETVARPEPTEDLEVEIVRFDEAVRRCAHGEICDAKTIVTIMRHYLRREAGR
jgi:ADP-ribose pyrophosphatase